MNSISRVGTSKYKGVNYNKDTSSWKAQIGIDGIQKYLGLFKKEKDAAIAYDEAAIEQYGEFACLNFK